MRKLSSIFEWERRDDLLLALLGRKRPLWDRPLDARHDVRLETPGAAAQSDGGSGRQRVTGG